MKTLNIKDGYTTIQLSSFQCASLARACHLASEKTFSDDIDFWRTLAALFQACAIAGYAQWQMCPYDVEALNEQLDMVDLQESKSAL
jgi:hypothetical protein